MAYQHVEDKKQDKEELIKLQTDFREREMHLETRLNDIAGFWGISVEPDRDNLDHRVSQTIQKLTKKIEEAEANIVRLI